jgi:hypothetical protein
MNLVLKSKYVNYLNLTITDITLVNRTKFRRFLMEFFIQNLKEKVQNSSRYNY